MSKDVVVSLSYRLGLSNDFELVRLYLRQGDNLYFFDTETVVLE